MKRVLLIFVWLFCLAIAPGFAASPPVVTSPDGKISCRFRLSHAMPEYAVAYKGETIIGYSSLRIFFDTDSLTKGVSILNYVLKDSVEAYTLPVGRNSAVRDSFRSLVVTLKSLQDPERRISVEFRVFNDGMAFRYHFPGASGDSVVLRRELSAFRISGNPSVHALVLPGYRSSHEGNYHRVSFNELPEDSLMDMPVLFSWPQKKVYMALTEAALLDYAGMYLVKEKGVLYSRLSPRLDLEGVAVKAAYPHRSPWRVVMIADRPGRFLETNLLTDLAPPQQLADMSWIRPGTSTFPWWNGNVTTDTLNAPGNNFVTQQYYIDFCARNHIAYHSVVEYGLHQWYQDDGVGFQPGPHPDVTRPVPGLDMKEVCDYAHSKGVGVRVWVHFYALYPQLDSAFAIYEKWGLSGMMVDFMDRDDQQMVNMQTEILEKAARHHLHIQFHGAYKPTGLARTYPNEFTREGTRNYEVNKWSNDGLSPDHDLDIAFTRGLAGSTDYHLGGFRAVTPDHFRAQYTRPLQLGTRCHMLAMYVVLENAVSMVCDYPEAYEGQPGFEFIREVPTTWDETKVLSGEPDASLVIARRKGKDWYIAGISNSDPQQLSLSVSLDFLGRQTYSGWLWRDVPPADPKAALRSQTYYTQDSTRRLSVGEDFDPNRLIRSRLVSPSPMRLVIPVAPGGGFVAHLSPDGGTLPEPAPGN